VSYREHGRPVVVDLGTPGAPAGSRGEGDFVENVEIVHGTGFADRLTAPDTGGSLMGYAGDDVLRGGPGHDRIYGEGGADRIAAGGGNDVVVGDRGRDVVDAGGGDDHVAAEMVGQYGRGEPGSVICGPGMDQVSPLWDYGPLRPPRDAIDVDCESALLDLAMPDVYNLPVELPLRSLRMRLSCSRCRVGVTLRTRGRSAGSSRRDVREGRHATLAVPLARFARERFGRTGVLRLRASLAARWGRDLRHRRTRRYTLVVRRSSVSRPAPPATRPARPPRARLP
jgi:hypothetical protein